LRWNSRWKSRILRSISNIEEYFNGEAMLMRSVMGARTSFVKRCFQRQSASCNVFVSQLRISLHFTHSGGLTAHANLPLWRQSSLGILRELAICAVKTEHRRTPGRNRLPVVDSQEFPEETPPSLDHLGLKSPTTGIAVYQRC
jgi:hypothetical protein